MNRTLQLRDFFVRTILMVIGEICCRGAFQLNFGRYCLH